MLSAAPAPAIFFHTDATDMRKSFTGLCGLVHSVAPKTPATSPNRPREGVTPTVRGWLC